MYIIGQRLKHLRKRQKLNQTDMSKLLNVTSRHYQDIEYGKVNISSEMLTTLSNFFNVTTDYLLGIGIFENWEEIERHWDIIMDAVTSQFNNFDSILKQAIAACGENKIAIGQLLSMFVTQIVIHEINNQPIIKIVLKEF